MACKPKCILQCSYTHTSGMQQVHRSYVHVCGRQVHSRACHCVEFSLSLSLLFSPFTFCSSLRFLLSRFQELVVISVFRALPYFLWEWQNASQREQVRDSSSDERKIADYSPRLLHGSSTDRNAGRTWFLTYTRNERCEGIYPRAKTYLQQHEKFFIKRKYYKNKHLSIFYICNARFLIWIIRQI